MHFNAMFRFFINTMTVERHYFGQKSKPQPNSINKISLNQSHLGDKYVTNTLLPTFDCLVPIHIWAMYISK